MASLAVKRSIKKCGLYLAKLYMANVNPADNTVFHS